MPLKSLPNPTMKQPTGMLSQTTFKIHDGPTNYSSNYEAFEGFAIIQILRDT